MRLEFELGLLMSLFGFLKKLPLDELNPAAAATLGSIPYALVG
jgi:hypothetical protein